MADVGRTGAGRAARALSGTARNSARVTAHVEDLLELARLARRERRAREAQRFAASVKTPAR